METADQDLGGAPESTSSEVISGLGVDVQVMYQRVCSRLGLVSPDEPLIGRYRIKTKLGEGGMGVVYLAYDPQLEREVAVKVVTSRPLAGAAKLRARLLREAQLLAKLSHPNVVTVHDAGEHAGEVFLAMEYVAGQSLREWQDRSDHPREQLLRVYVEAGRGLAAAHEQGIVHRDFKPDNVFISAEGHALVGDFGLANLLAEPQANIVAEPDSPHAASAQARMTQTGELLGTLGYMAPEQLRGDEIDARTDQYAYCVSLWEAAAGTKPFPGRTREALLELARGGVEPNGGERLPPWLRRALQVGLAATPGDRHASMAELVAILERGLGRRDRWLLGGAFTILGLFAFFGGELWGSTAEAADDCAVVDEVTAIQTNDAWPTVLARLDDRTSTRLAAHLTRLEDHGCVPGDPAQTQTNALWLARLGNLLDRAPAWSDVQLREIAGQLANARFDAAPPEPLSEPVFTKLRELSVLEDEERLVKLVAEAKLALDAASSDVDRAALGLCLGRAQLYLGDYVAAMSELRDARDHADSAGYDDVRVQANLLLAKTEIMRLDHFEAGRDYLSVAHAILDREHEPRFSPRRAEYLEIAATLARHEGAVAEAARAQRLVVLRHFIAGSRFELATALVNLAHVEHDLLGDGAAAERWSRLALLIAPGDVEAALNLGRLLGNRDALTPAEGKEARDLLELALASERRDLHVLARVVLLQLELDAKAKASVIAKRRDQLVELLAVDRSATSAHLQQAWAFVLLGYATLGEFGPGYATAAAQFEASLGEALDSLWFAVQVDVEVATLAAEPRPDIARARLERARTRLDQLPDSDAKSALLAQVNTVGEQLEPASR